MGAIFRWVKELWLSRKALGQVVERALDILPQTATEALFTITGGRVKVTSIIGEVTTAIENLAVNARLSAAPTTGGGADICGALNIQNFVVGRLLGITGIPIDALGSRGGVNPAQTQGVILKAGTLTLTTDANRTGKVKWTLHYVPVDVGAVITATAV